MDLWFKKKKEKKITDKYATFSIKKAKLGVHIWLILYIRGKLKYIYISI